MKVKENYVNVIPMKEIRSTDDLLFPFPIYNELRSQGDIRYDETRKCWDLFRYADIQSVLKQPKVFSSQRGLPQPTPDPMRTLVRRKGEPWGSLPASGRWRHVVAGHRKVAEAYAWRGGRVRRAPRPWRCACGVRRLRLCGRSARLPRSLRHSDRR